MKKLSTLAFLFSLAASLSAAQLPAVTVLSAQDEAAMGRMVAYAMENNRVPDEVYKRSGGKMLATLGNTMTGFDQSRNTYYRDHYRLDVLKDFVLVRSWRSEKPVHGKYVPVEAGRYLFNSKGKFITGVLPAAVPEIPQGLTCIATKAQGPKVSLANLTQLLRSAVRSATKDILIRVASKYPRL